MLNTPQINAANKRALAIWNGYDPVNGTHLHTSDRQLLSKLCGAAQKGKHTGATVGISEPEIRELMKVAGLKPLFIKNAIDYDGLANWFNRSGVYERIAAAAKLDLPAACLETLGMLMEVAEALHNDDEQGQQVALASRILFFALPELPFFNVSSSVAEALNINHRAPGGLARYWEALEALLEQHYTELAACEKPANFKTHANNEQIMTAEQGKWWMRRVLDFALVAE